MYKQVFETRKSHQQNLYQFSTDYKILSLCYHFATN